MKTGFRRIALSVISLSFVVWLLTVEHFTLLRVGNPAPDCIGTDQNGSKIDIRQFRGLKNVVLFFYPKDFTTGCTAEACAFRDRFSTIVGSDAVIIGISRDDMDSHRSFSSAYSLPYHLISDRDGVIGEKYGVLWFGGMIHFMKRVTYVIDKGGLVRGVFRHEFNVSRHVEDVLSCLETIRSK